MRQYVLVVAAVAIVSLVNNVECRSISKRQIAADSSLDPVANAQDLSDEDRDKRQVGHDHGQDDPKFAVKNAILGFVFHKINSFIDKKTAFIDQLDKQNIAKNKAHGIEPPKDPVTSISGVISGAIGQKLQAVGPLIPVVLQKITQPNGLLGGSGFNIGALFGASSGGGGGGADH